MSIFLCIIVYLDDCDDCPWQNLPSVFSSGSRENRVVNKQHQAEIDPQIPLDNLSGPDGAISPRTWSPARLLFYYQFQYRAVAYSEDRIKQTEKKNRNRK